MQGIGIIVLLLGVVFAGVGYYYYTQPPPKLTLDWWYESSGHYPQSADQAAVYKSQLEKTGLITVNLHGADWPSYKKNRDAHTMQVYTYGWYPDYIDPDDYIQPFLDSVGGSWLGTGYSNPDMDKLIAQARSTPDPTQRAQLYANIQQIMVKDAPLVPVWQGYAWAVTKPDVTGVNLDVTQNMYYWLITPPAGKDTLIVGTTDSIETSLDPAELWDYFGAEMSLNLGSSLVYIKAGSSAGPNDFVPGLATDWSVSPDGLTYTFNLRQGLKFSDGAPFTSAAVKYSFDRNMNLAIPDGPQVGLAYNATIASVTTPSDYQVVFTLKHSYAPFMALMAFSGSFIVNPKRAPNVPGQAVEWKDGDPTASNPNDLGAYLLTEWSRKGGKDYEMKLDANPNYWGIADGYPKAKHIIMKFYSDATALALAIKSGDIDMAYRQLASSDIKNMQSDPSLKLWKGPGGIQYIVFQEHMAPLDNPKVRQAIAAALDRNELVNTVFLGQAAPLYSMIPNGMAFQTDAYKTLGDANTALATSTLEGLGYSGTTPQSIIQLGLAALGVGIVLIVVGAILAARKPKSKA